MFPSVRLPRKVVLLSALVACEAAVAVTIYGVERARLRAARDRIRYGTPPAHAWREYAVPAVVVPEVVRASASGLSPGEPVIGVEIEGKARAYRIAAMTDRSRHVVNDRIAGVPISVAYCDLTDCVQVYTGPRGPGTLNVSVAGLYDGEMVVSAAGQLYLHKSGAPFRHGGAVPSRPFPYDLRPAVRTTWAEWLRRHPDTEVYRGDRPGEAEPAP